MAGRQAGLTKILLRAWPSDQSSSPRTSVDAARWLHSVFALLVDRRSPKCKDVRFSSWANDLPLSARNPPEKHSPWVSNGDPLSSLSYALNSLVGCPHCRMERIAHEQQTVGHCMANQRTARIAPRLPALRNASRLQSELYCCRTLISRLFSLRCIDNYLRRVWHPN